MTPIARPSNHVSNDRRTALHVIVAHDLDTLQQKTIEAELAS
jgi:hypothetical protein